MARKGMLKGEVDKLLIGERKKMRQAHKESKFKQRTLSIFKHQKERAEELKLPLTYDLEEFRAHIREQLGVGTCPYCECKITEGSFVCDHRKSVSRGGAFNLENAAACCKSCNWRKGSMHDDEFVKFNKFITENLPEEVVRDIRARLSTGGKWFREK